MEALQDYNTAQMEAIEDYYNTINEYDEAGITMEEAIVNWFAEGFAEKFREEYLNSIDLPAETEAS